MAINRQESIASQGDHLLIILDKKEPQMVDQIRKEYPDLKVTYIAAEKLVQVREDEVPKEALEEATIVAYLPFNDILRPERCPNLKYIHTFTAGIDSMLNKPIVTETNVAVTTSSGIHGPPIGEWVVLNWLIASKRYNLIREGQLTHEWKPVSVFQEARLHDQAGRRVGIIGYGSIGRHIGRLAAALGMEVLAYTASPRETPESRRDDGYIIPGTGDPDGIIPSSWYYGRDKASLHHFLAQNLDHVVLSLPLTPHSACLLGAEEFSILSRNNPRPEQRPFVTNISRGRIIDQDALAASLRSGELGGAALDVADPEPLPAQHPLWSAPNIQISPHISGLGIEYMERALDILRLNIGRLRRGEKLINAYQRGADY